MHYCLVHVFCQHQFIWLFSKQTDDEDFPLIFGLSCLLISWPPISPIALPVTLVHLWYLWKSVIFFMWCIATFFLWSVSKFQLKLLSFQYELFFITASLQEGCSNNSINNYCCDKASSWSSWEEQLTRCDIYLFLWRRWHWSSDCERHPHSPGFIYWKFKGTFFVCLLGRQTLCSKI